MGSEISFDVIVVGAGIAGASVAAELSNSQRVLLLEMERQPGYHTTGRSAAIYSPSYGPPPIRALTRASGKFFDDPPSGFSNGALLSPRGILMIAAEAQLDNLDALIDEVAHETDVERLNAAELRVRQPLLRQGYAAGAMYDPAGRDIDVAALHQGYLGHFQANGGQLSTKAEVLALERDGSNWRVHTTDEVFSSPIVVNAAGAWAGEIGLLAEAEDIGLVPKRRTAVMIAAPAGVDCAGAPLTVDVDEAFYLKPDAGRLLISPADETPSAACDVQPEEMDVAICIDRIETAFDLSVRKIESKWAGLRSFVTDKSPVAGYSLKAPGIFWLAGQGGYGIQTSPALSRTASALILGQKIPQDVLDAGLDGSALSPQRLLPVG